MADLLKTQSATARISRGLVARWRFDGNGVDDVNGLTGTFSGGSSFVSDYRGVPNGAANFNGSDGRFIVGHDPRLNSPSWTIVATVSVNADLDCDGLNNWRGLIGKITGSTSGPSAGFSVILEQSRQVILRAGGAGSPGAGIRTVTSLDIGRTYSLAFVYDEVAGQIRVYIDGVLSGTYGFTPGTQNPPSLSNLWVGGFHNLSPCPNGAGGSPSTFSDLRFYDRVLSVPEITALWQPASTHSATQSAKGRISHSRAALQTARARISESPFATQSATARVIRNINLNAEQTARARLSQNRVKAQTARALIVETKSADQSARARVSQDSLRSQSATARIIYQGPSGSFRFTVTTPARFTNSVELPAQFRTGVNQSATFSSKVEKG